MFKLKNIKSIKKPLGVNQFNKVFRLEHDFLTVSCAVWDGYSNNFNVMLGRDHENVISKGVSLSFDGSLSGLKREFLNYVNEVH